jgi:hypothetical protein
MNLPEVYKPIITIKKPNPKYGQKSFGIALKEEEHYGVIFGPTNIEECLEVYPSQFEDKNVVIFSWEEPPMEGDPAISEDLYNWDKNSTSWRKV